MGLMRVCLCPLCHCAECDLVTVPLAATSSSSCFLRWTQFVPTSSSAVGGVLAALQPP